MTRYVATIRGVHEVVLVGRADLAAWTRRLAPHGLVPSVCEGAAEITIGTFRSRWMGLQFAEAIVAVTLRHAEPADACFLLQGYNTNRFFAFVERARFGTPYRHARLEVRTAGSIGFDLDGGAGHVVQASMGRRRADATPEASAFAGRVYLPGAAGGYFLARLEGTRRHHAFDPAHDALVLPGSAGPLGCLAETDFVPTGWQVGTDALHARSKTMRAR